MIIDADRVRRLLSMLERYRSLLAEPASDPTIWVMRSTPLLTRAQPLGGCVVRVHFEDGTAGDVDLSYLLDYGGVFEALRDSELRRLRADPEAGTIVWPNQADIAPETLYALAQRRATVIA